MAYPQSWQYQEALADAQAAREVYKRHRGQEELRRMLEAFAVLHFWRDMDAVYGP